MNLKSIFSLLLLLPLVVACGNSTKAKKPVVGSAASVAKMSNASIIDAVKNEALNVKGYIKSDLSSSVDGNWFTADPELDGYQGTSTDRAYAELQLKDKYKPVLVAVIDSGVDINHEDLQGRIWVNEDEIPGNGIDDDNNGYVDDIHGWNFIGGRDGSHVDADTLEVTREYVRYQKRIDSGEVLSAKEMAYYNGVKEKVEGSRAYAQRVLTIYGKMYHDAENYKKILREKAGVTSFTYANITSIRSSDKEVISAKNGLLVIMDKVALSRLVSIYEYFTSQLKYHYNLEFNSREIVGDDPSDLNDSDYGNNDVQGPDASHGTHVSGIIGAVRHNGKGINGVANNVRIMAVRAVPNGDERDKDVANAVRYAVDNGAQIINMSFGKSYSPYKSHVDEAFQYAADHNVLVVHAAGNDNANIDEVSNFPNRFLGEGSTVYQHGGEVATWLEIGASTAIKGLNLPADFSNYGIKAVNLFAPGHDILSTVPGSIYDTYSGTSMACPVVSGVAALVISQYPQIGAVELRELLIDTVRLYDGLNVYLPGTTDVEIPFKNLSITGGVVDALTALKLAGKRFGNNQTEASTNLFRRFFTKK